MTDKKSTQRPVFDLYWERLGAVEPAKAKKHGGKPSWPVLKKMKRAHMLYRLTGRHAVYGPHALLYIGRTERGPKRVREHLDWIAMECGQVELHVASVGHFMDWQEWRGDKRERYPQPADVEIVRRIETLLIFAHQPAYNSQSIARLGDEVGKSELRLFNTGRFGPLLPELSARRYADVALPKDD